mgnify:CR=1 FL=1
MFTGLRIVLIFANSCFGASLFAAECPNASDLDQGVVLLRNEARLTSIFTRDGGLLSEIRQTPAQVIYARYQHPLLVSERWAEGRDDYMTAQYDVAAAELDNLRPGRRIVRDVTVTQADGAKVAGRVTWVVERFDYVTIGNCRYSVLQYHEKLALEGYDMIRTVKFFAPDVGLVLRSIAVDVNWKAVRDLRFDQISASQR